MKLFLCGGGSGSQTTEAMKVFAKLIDRNKPLLYVPLAMNEEKYPSCLEWITEEMKSIQLTNIEMVTSKETLVSKNFEDYCAIFIGGGNTYKLLKDLKDSGAFTKIKEFIEKDGIVFGGSAGAIIFGEDINTCLYSDNNDVVKLDNTQGFNILNNISLLCHYNENSEKTLQNIEYLKRISQAKKIIYLPEENTIFVNDDNVEMIGNKKYCVIEDGIVQVVDCSQDI